MSSETSLVVGASDITATNIRELTNILSRAIETAIVESSVEQSATTFAQSVEDNDESSVSSASVNESKSARLFFDKFIVTGSADDSNGIWPLLALHLEFLESMRASRRSDGDGAKDETIFPSQSSRFRAMIDASLAFRSRVFDSNREALSRIKMLRLCGFGAKKLSRSVSEKAANRDDDGRKGSFRNCILHTNVLTPSMLEYPIDAATSSDDSIAMKNSTSTRNLLDRTVESQMRRMLRMRREIRGERDRLTAAGRTVETLYSEILGLGARFNDLLERLSTSRYGETWYEYRTSSSDNSLRANESENDENSDASFDRPLIDESMKLSLKQVSFYSTTSPTVTMTDDDEKRRSNGDEDNDGDDTVLRNFVSERRWREMTQLDELLAEIQALRVALAETGGSAETVIRRQLAALESELLAEETGRRDDFVSEMEAIETARVVGVERLNKLTNLRKDANDIETSSRAVRSIVSRATHILLNELRDQKMENFGLMSNHQNANKRVLHIMQTIAHAKTKTSEIPTTTRNYLQRIAYPRVVDCHDLHTMRVNICSTQCRRMLRIAVPNTRRFRLEQAIHLKHEDVEAYATANEMRDCLVACLYFYGVDELYFELLEAIRDYMLQRTKVKFSATEIYEFWKMRNLFRQTNDKVKSKSNEGILSAEDATRLSRGIEMLRGVELDLRFVPSNVFRALLTIFRHRSTQCQ